MYRILMEDDAKPKIDAQRRLNPTMKEVITITHEDQEKTMFTCPYGTFTFRRMPFGLCNAPAIFQRCMMAIFSDMHFYTFWMNGVPFEFDGKCHHDFTILKEKLTSTPIVVAPNWEFPFELLCDASDYEVGAVLGQRFNKVFKMIYYASHTLNDAQVNYATTENELLVIVFAFGKFWPYLIGNMLEVEESPSMKEVQINDVFPDEQLFEVKENNEVLWFADYVNFLAVNIVPPEMSI
ncbi:uncharacterized protein LOC133783289 [Humulus lupulus]|uniref:uncharacterized protein LOC133783289 n=1 Tax=Humulus lupulus TaxID=3486 RepID=UPI002B40AFE0|nr:uncharacterized protein LOC133783289 [Humulus lupulus]